MAESISARADRLFEAANALAQADAKMITAEHAAKGLLQSGATIRRITKAFAERSRTALDESLASVASRVDHRGRKWRSMMALVDDAIDRHMDGAAARVAHLTRAAAPNSEALVAPILAEIRRDLHTRLADYREGWTAPREKPWRERNALIYALLLLLAGAAFSEGVKWLSSKPVPVPAASPVMGESKTP